MEKISNYSSLNNIILFLVIYLSIAFLFYTYSIGIIGDHRHYVAQWSLLNAGQNPWLTDNTYGPIHTILGYLIKIDPLAPKILMILMLLVGNFFLINEFIKVRGFDKFFIVYLLAVPTNVLFISLTFVHGMNDTIVAAFIILAIIARFYKHNLSVGILISLAALTKYYPILILPFFALDGKSFRWSIIISGILTFLIGMFFGYSIWGQPMIDALIYGGSRGASGFSILLDLTRYGYDNQIVDLLIRYNALAVVFSVLLIFIFSKFVNLSWIEGATLSYIALLIIYKVGHSQFFLPWLFLVSALPILKTPRAERISIIFIPSLIYLSYYQLSMDLGTNLLGNRPYWIEFYAGFISAPFFIIPWLLTIILIITTRRMKFWTTASH